MQNLTFKAHACASAGEAPDYRIDYRKPVRYGARLDVPTLEEAQAIAARFPKSRKVIGTTISGSRDGKHATWGYVGLRTNLHPDGTTGPANEIGIKRWFAFKRDCERLGIAIQWDSACFRNAYPSMESFEEAITNENVAPLGFRKIVMSELTFQDFVYVYEPGEGQTYQCGRYTVRPQLVGYSNFYSALFRGQLLGGSESFLGAVEICARHELLTR
jgi:hypothetical protein